MPNILIVDDHPLIRMGMGMLVENIVERPTLYFCCTYQQALDELSRCKMDLIILDLIIPGGKGLSMIKGLRDIQTNVRILVCSGRDELTNAPDYIQHGADGFLHKSYDQHEAEKAINTVLNNKKYISGKVQDAILTKLMDNKAKSSDMFEPLSTREKQVLRLLLAGKWIKEIAEELDIRTSTVSTQKARIFQKLEVDNIVDLARKVWAYENDSSAEI